MSEAAAAARSGEPVNGAAYFGEEVRALREAFGLSQGQLADQLHYRQAQVSKVENGVVLASAAFAEALDRVAGTPGTYARLRERMHRCGYPEWFAPYLELERTARKIEDFSAGFVPGPLQTPEYAESVYRAADPEDDDAQIKEKVAARLRRREHFDREQPPELWVLLHENALRLMVGSPAVMVGQLDHLLVEAASSRLFLQVVPVASGTPTTISPFTLFTREDGEAVLYAEAAGHGRVLESHTTVEKWAKKYDRLRASAESELQSQRLIRKIREEYANEQRSEAA